MKIQKYYQHDSDVEIICIILNYDFFELPQILCKLESCQEYVVWTLDISNLKWNAAHLWMTCYDSSKMQQKNSELHTRKGQIAKLKENELEKAQNLLH